MINKRHAILGDPERAGTTVTGGLEFAEVPFHQQEIRPVTQKSALTVNIYYTVSDGLLLWGEMRRPHFQLARRSARPNFICVYGGASDADSPPPPARPVLPIRLSPLFHRRLPGPVNFL